MESIRAIQINSGLEFLANENLTSHVFNELSGYCSNLFVLDHDVSHYCQSQAHDNQFEFFVIRLNPLNYFSSVSLSYILSKTSRLHTPSVNVSFLEGLILKGSYHLGV